jgi:dipeptidyl aminopeptidase/acylaminoacyl peptidase
LIAFNNASPNPKAKYEVWMFDVAARGSSPFIQSGSNERDAVFSPDGRYLAYVSDESGRQEVYVRPFRPVRERWRVSSDGGSQPSWRRDAKELFYVSADNRLMSVSVESGPEPQFGSPSPLFEAPLQTSATDISLYAATADGERFLMVTARKATLAPLSVMLNWPETLRR